MTTSQNTKQTIISKDFSGEKFYRLFVLGKSENNRRKVICKCDCGNTKEVSIYSLLSGETKSCGCLSIEASKANGRSSCTHGRRKRADGQKSDPTYRAWIAMRLRCNNKNSQPYENYGGRGISVCERWDNFDNFLEDMGENLNGLTLDRIDNSLGYFKENCRWATYTEQNRNKRGVKITMEIANKIRKDTRVHRIIANDYGISRENVGFIKRGIIWVDESHG